MRFPGGAVVRNLPASAADARDPADPWVRKISWSRKQHPPLVFLSGKFHGQRSLAGYSPWGDKELNMTEHAHAHTHTSNAITCASRAQLSLQLLYPWKPLPLPRKRFPLQASFLKLLLLNQSFIGTSPLGGEELTGQSLTTKEAGKHLWDRDGIQVARNSPNRAKSAEKPEKMKGYVGHSSGAIWPMMTRHIYSLGELMGSEAQRWYYGLNCVSPQFISSPSRWGFPGGAGSKEPTGDEADTRESRILSWRIPWTEEPVTRELDRTEHTRPCPHLQYLRMCPQFRDRVFAEVIELKWDHDSWP